MELVIGTSEGVFVANGAGAPARAAGLEGRSIRAFCRANGGLLAGASDGVYRSGSGGRFSPSLLGTWKAAEQATFYAQYAFGYKAPSATQLYTNYGGPGTYLRVGNPYLKPETSKGWELGARLGDDRLGGSVAAFDNRYRNFIDNNVPLSPSSPQWQDGWDVLYPLGVTGMVNRASVRIYGAEATAHWSLNSWDQTQIPKPFATIALVIGEPFIVPRDAGDEVLEQYRLHLEEEIRKAERRCFELLAGRR